MRRRAASQLGLQRLGLARLAQTAAAELDSVCARCGWLAVEEGAGWLSKGFVRRWTLLWRDPACDFEQVL